ncbi:MAG TPA: hypothetical protein VGW11_07840 [Solirubrobacteraceae bacterium]|nr:hypothetical protein [Solirubrobacteraceae bacterium]
MAGVSALTFLVARAVPGGYWVALAGGVPLARAGQRGAREGYATAGASLVETTAVMGPARLGIAVPHAASAPLLGVLDRRGAGYLALAVAGALVRYVYYLITLAFYIWVLVGLDAYTGTYERARDLLPFLPAGEAAAIWVSAVGMAFWSGGAGLIQAWVIRRGLRRWPADPEIAAVEPEREPAQTDARAGVRDPRVVVGVAALLIAGALATTEPLVLAVVAGLLTVLWALSAARLRSLAGGLALATPLALSTLAFGLVGGIGEAQALQRTARVALLVLIAVWMRAAAGPDGLRDVSLRLVRRLPRVRILALTAAVLGASAGAADYGASARRLGARLRATRKRPAPVLDAVLLWIGNEASHLSRGRSAGGKAVSDAV